MQTTRRYSLSHLIALAAFLLAMLFSLAYVRKGAFVATAVPNHASRPSSSLAVTSEKSSSDIEFESESSTPFLPDDRPDWIGQPDRFEGDTHRWVVSTELAESEEEAFQNLDAALLESVQGYIDRVLFPGRALSGKLRPLNAAWIREHLLVGDREYLPTIERPSGKYRQLWVQLESDEEDRATLQKWGIELERRTRAGLVGLGIAALWVAISLAHGMLRWFGKETHGRSPHAV